jgi:hypothetical protein
MTTSLQTVDDLNLPGNMIVALRQMALSFG